MDDDDVGHIALAASQRLAFVALVENLSKPSFRQQRLDEGRQLARRCLTYQHWAHTPLRLPAPLEIVMGQPAKRIAMPSDQKIQSRLVDRRFGGPRLDQEEAFGALSLAIPFILTRQHPDGVSRSLGGSMLLHLSSRHLGAHLGGDGVGVFTSQSKGFEKALARRGHIDA